MTTNPSLPDPHEWHTSKIKPCPVCGITSYVGRSVGGFYEHRAVHPNEGRLHKWARRALVTTKRDKAGVIKYLYGNGHLSRTYQRKPDSKNPGNRTDLRGERGKYGPTAATRDRIVRVASLVANGKTRAEIATILKVSLQSLYWYRVAYTALWRQCGDSAKLAVRETVRQLAGTPGMLADIDAYTLAAARAEEWSRERNEPLFDRGDALTLPMFYERYYLPLRPASLGSASRDRIILRRWAILTADPPLTEISSQHLIMFRDSLLKSRGMKRVGYMSPNTVRHYMAQIQTLLDKAGPSGWRNRDALELIPKVPWVKPPRKIHRAVKIVSEETLNNFYLGCIAADCPESPDFKPAAWWRALVVFLYNVGLRRGTLFKLRMEWVNWERRYIEIPAEKTKTGMGQIIPLNQTVFAHLQAIRGEREYLFDFGGPIDRWFYTIFHELQYECGIPQSERFGLHDLRRTCATAMWECNPAAAQFALGHTSMDTTANFYVRGQGMLARAVEQMPQPAAFNSPSKDGLA